MLGGPYEIRFIFSQIQFYFFLNSVFSIYIFLDYVFSCLNFLDFSGNHETYNVNINLLKV